MQIPIKNLIPFSQLILLMDLEAELHAEQSIANADEVRFDCQHSKVSEKECVECGKTFIAVNDSMILCSEKCYDRFTENQLNNDDLPF